MQGWARTMAFPATLLPWIPPSPNIPTYAVAEAYAATVFLEATTIAEGRGTTTPFLLFGAPFLDAQVCRHYLYYFLIFFNLFSNFNHHPLQVCVVLLLAYCVLSLVVFGCFC